MPGDFNKDEGRTHFYSADDTGADERLEKPRKTLPLPWNRASGDSEEAKERMTWWHAFGLFWQAPVTLFVAGPSPRSPSPSLSLFRLPPWACEHRGWLWRV